MWLRRCRWRGKRFCGAACNPIGENWRMVVQLGCVCCALCKVQSQVEQRFANDEQQKDEYIASQRHCNDAADNDRDVQNDDASIRLEHQNWNGGPAVLAMA